MRILSERPKAFEQMAQVALKLEHRHGAEDIAEELSVLHGKPERAFGETKEL